MSKQKIVVIGGGTGSFVIITGLKHLENIHITAIVTSMDSGGSTGRLRDEFGYLPVGDIRQCLVALSQDQDSHLLRELFSYRFSKGEEGLKGHNLGNLLITALSDILGSETAAIQATQKLLKIEGDVLPVSLTNTQLVAHYANGKVLQGEHNIDAPPYPHNGNMRIDKLELIPKASTYLQVKDAISEADIILIGPGDLYTSIFPNLLVDGVAQAINGSTAKVVYTLNLMTKFAQTANFTAQDHVNEVSKYLGKRPDYVLINNTPLPQEVLTRYLAQDDFPVTDDLPNEPWVVRTDLLATEQVVTPAGDVVKRSLIRHDGHKIAKVIRYGITSLQSIWQTSP